MLVQRYRNLSSEVMTSRKKLAILLVFQKRHKAIVFLTTLCLASACSRVYIYLYHHAPVFTRLCGCHRFEECVRPCVVRICSVRSLFCQVEDLRRQSFSKEDHQHETMLLEVTSSPPHPTHNPFHHPTHHTQPSCSFHHPHTPHTTLMLLPSPPHTHTTHPAHNPHAPSITPTHTTHTTHTLTALVDAVSKCRAGGQNH